MCEGMPQRRVTELNDLLKDGGRLERAQNVVGALAVSGLREGESLGHLFGGLLAEEARST